MSQNNKIEGLWSELSLIENTDERRQLIYSDSKNKNPVYAVLAEEDPLRLFEFLRGNDFEIIKTNWAIDYSYNDYIAQYGLDYEEEESENWDLAQKSIEHALDTGHWYVTGACTIIGPENIKLNFEFDYCDGYLDSVLKTPYSKARHSSFGIAF